ncbi:hypothetical protein F5Y01DRAFT_300986 [Xylaria sp. FL0043]|nr:hypothetical protein F5Y01DRAFT_300986 [Xylaria sp. FL0043]
MAVPRNQRKRKHQHDSAVSQGARPPQKKAKKAKPSVKQHPPNFSPQFWDQLSKIPLTPRALRELDRRNSIQPQLGIEIDIETPGREGGYSCIARFARHGGPDLRHLRGYPEPSVNVTTSTITMSFSGHPGASSVSGRPTGSAKSATKKSKASSRGPDFEQHLVDHGIYLDKYRYPNGRPNPEPGNLDQIRQALSSRRASLSPSRFPESEFHRFRKKNDDAVLEGDVTNGLIVPMLCGDAGIPHQENILCTELKPITNENTTKPKPDSYDGCRLDDISKNIRDDKHMYELIIPTRHPRAPIAPNFFLEVKPEDGDPAVMRREACYDSAYGVRAMHSLQNYGQKVPVYDGNAYTFSSTYHSGASLLLLYAHHSTPPTVGDRPEYHMTKIKSFDLSNDYETFIMGATALRNARDLAKRYRDGFIDAANLRARGTGRTQSPGQAQDTDRPRTASDDSRSHDETEADGAITPLRLP